MTTILSRGTVRDSIKPTDVSLLAYTSLAYFTTNEESVLPHRFDYTVNPNSIVNQYAVPAVFNTFGIRLPRRTLVFDSGLLAYPSIAYFGSEGIPTTRIGLPVLNALDDAQIIVRGGSFRINFTGSPLRGLPPHGVKFRNRSQSPVNIWTWEFGDGKTSHRRNPEHIYLTEGDFDVTLRAGAPTFGYAHLTRIDYVIVGVRLFIDPESGEAPLNVKFRLDERQLGD
jgi:hypothetical protein